MPASNLMRYEFHLFGPLNGKSMNIGGHQFIAGKYQIVAKPEDAKFVIRYLSHWQAYAKGTPEYAAAVEKENGAGKVQGDARSGQAEALSGNVQSDGREFTPSQVDEVSGHAGSAQREAGLRSEGNGHTDAGVPNFEEADSLKPPTEPTVLPSETLRAAVMKLDPDNVDHWTQAGLPKLSVIDEVLGRAGATRKDVEAAVPGWTRDKALERIAADL
jgi:hypothetical protein